MVAEEEDAEGSSVVGGVVFIVPASSASVSVSTPAAFSNFAAAASLMAFALIPSNFLCRSFSVLIRKQKVESPNTAQWLSGKEREQTLVISSGVN